VETPNLKTIFRVIQQEGSQGVTRVAGTSTLSRFIWHRALKISTSVKAGIKGEKPNQIFLRVVTKRGKSVLNPVKPKSQTPAMRERKKRPGAYMKFELLERKTRKKRLQNR